MLKTIKRYRQLLPPYKIFYLDPNVRLYTQHEKIKKLGYYYAKSASEYFEFRDSIKNKKENHVFFVYDKETGMFWLIQWKDAWFHSFPSLDGRNLQIELNMKKLLGKSYRTEFFVVCLKKKNVPTWKLFFVLLIRKLAVGLRFK